MRHGWMVPVSLAAMMGCGVGAPEAPNPARSWDASALATHHERHRASGLDTRRFSPEAYWTVLGGVVEGSADLDRREVGRSAEGRPIYLIRYGRGATRVLLWSQMHGDESTASMALVDVFRYLSDSSGDLLATSIGEALTVLAVPVLNPDGAARFQRRNSQGIDVNRDARMLATPEARALKAVQEEYRPAFGFNLHDQNVRTRVGNTDRLAAIALLAPPPDGSGVETESSRRAKRVAAVIRSAVDPLVGGHVTRYDDTFNPRAFGDLMQSWGVSTVLVESGGWRDDPEKQHLRRTNFVGLLAALAAIASGEYEAADTRLYESLPRNGRSASDVWVRGGTIVAPGLPAYRADLVIDFQEPLARRGGRVADVGDLPSVIARDTVDATGLFIHMAAERLRAQGGGPAYMAPGVGADFVIRRGEDPGSEAVWVVEDGVAREGRVVP